MKNATGFTKQPTFCDFMREKVGANWVIARRSPRIVRKYGDDVATISQAAYRKLNAEYEARFRAAAAKIDGAL